MEIEVKKSKKNYSFLLISSHFKTDGDGESLTSDAGTSVQLNPDQSVQPSLWIPMKTRTSW
jgi:hypothetical protein